MGSFLYNPQDLLFAQMYSDYITKYLLIFINIMLLLLKCLLNSMESSVQLFLATKFSWPPTVFLNEP